MKRLLAFLLVSAMIFALAVPVSAAGASRTEKEILQQVNRERAVRDLGKLQLDEDLMEAAATRAREIMDSFSHTRPDGSRWNTVSDLVYAENLAMGHTNAQMVMDDWMDSKGHRQNILRSSYTKIGICSIKGPDGVRYWVQEFGL